MSTPPDLPGEPAELTEPPHRAERSDQEARDPLLGETPSRPDRQPGELGPVELLRWAWRQLTSMRTALILLLLLKKILSKIWEKTGKKLVDKAKKDAAAAGKAAAKGK